MALHTGGACLDWRVPTQLLPYLQTTTATCRIDCNRATVQRICRLHPLLGRFQHGRVLGSKPLNQSRELLRLMLPDDLLSLC